MALELFSSNKFFAVFRDVSGNYVNPTAPTNATTGQWYHLVGVKNGTTGYLYIHGVQVASQTNSSLGTITTSDGSVPTIGRNGLAGAVPFAGQIDDVRVYNYALTATQIKQLFNEGSAVRFGPATGTP